MARRPTKIVEAAGDGDLEEIQTILRSYPDKVDIFRGGKTALLAASEHGHVNIIKYLYQNHADVNLHDYNDNTPLHYAVKGRSLNAVKILLELKADMSIKNKDGKTASQLACTLGYKDCVAVFQREDKDYGLDLTTTEDGARKKPVCAANFQNCAHGCNEKACVRYEPCQHTAVCFACCSKDKNCRTCHARIERISFSVYSQEVKEFVDEYHKLQSQNRELREAKMCKICEENDLDCVLLDCCHVICCNCAEKLAPQPKICPICRKDIKEYRKIFNN